MIVIITESEEQSLQKKIKSVDEIYNNCSI